MSLPADRSGIETARLTRRRLLALAAGKAVATGVIGWRLWQLQIRDGVEYRGLAENNRIDFRLIAPARGDIFDRDGTLLAGNENFYRILLTREKTRNFEEVLDRIGRLIPIAEAEQARVIAELESRAPFLPVVVAEDLSWDQVSSVAANAPALPGVDTEIGRRRFYPYGPEFSLLLGYVGVVSEADRKREESSIELQKLPQFEVGKTGLERGLDKRLRGRAGNAKVEVNADGRVMRELDRQPATTGEDIQLTVSQPLQSFALDRMKGLVASAVVMDAIDGDLLCIASLPHFDPNDFVGGISHADYRQLLDDERDPLWHRALQGVYPPASTFKMITALAALEDSKISPDQRVTCRGSIEVAGRRFHCWKKNGHGSIDLQRAISESCDVFFYRAAELAGIDSIGQMARRLGLGHRHELPLPEIASGLIPTRHWKLREKGEAWLPGDTFNAGIGQGFTLASALQLAVMTARIATGAAVRPRLLIDHKARTANDQAPLALSRSNLEIVRQGMQDVVNSSTGTARGATLQQQGFVMAGKTGTAQVRTITEQERSRGLLENDELDWRLRDHALFCGYVPFDNPRLAIAVIVEHGGSGSASAAPIAADILLRALEPEQQADRTANAFGDRTQMHALHAQCGQMAWAGRTA